MGKEGTHDIGMSSLLAGGSDRAESTCMESGWSEGGFKYSFNEYLSSTYYMHELYSGVPDRHDPPLMVPAT